MLASATALAGELADPVRLTALQVLAAEGPHTLSQLADGMGVSVSRLGNHLARLRARGLVTVERRGRHAVYRVGPGLGGVLQALARYAGGEGDEQARPLSPADLAHTCYDHAAGRLGVVVFQVLVQRGALCPPDGRDAELTLGSDLSAFEALGVSAEEVRVGRRKQALTCLDRTHRLPHLGGALGGAVLDSLVSQGLVRVVGGSRVLEVADRERLSSLLPGFLV